MNYFSGWTGYAAKQTNKAKERTTTKKATIIQAYMIDRVSQSACVEFRSIIAILNIREREREKEIA